MIAVCTVDVNLSDIDEDVLSAGLQKDGVVHDSVDENVVDFSVGEIAVYSSVFVVRDIEILFTYKNLRKDCVF